MQINLGLLIWAVLCLLPLALVLAVIFRKRKQQKESSRAPFKELQRRPAGETIRIKLETLDEKINDETMGLLLFPMLMILNLFALHPKDFITPVLFFMSSAGSSAFFGFKLFKLLRSSANYRLGFEGERFVGEELSRLIVLGFEIYHDVPFDDFNIDHILVGPRGVFVVETKTRRKPVGEDGRKEFRVQFDGRSLQWPWGSDSYGIEQANNNAKTLANWLSSAAGENVWAIPILTLPGWLVDRKVPSDGIYVLNPKEIYQVCSSQPEKLTEPQIRRVCHQLDQKCRIAMT
ncbi:MAG: nuclease-related domain-containing protein [Verrucomicrobiia bacterium]|jgi:hypothetical protein